MTVLGQTKFGGRQFKPNKPARRRAMSAAMIIMGAELNLPLPADAFGGGNSERRFGKLNEKISVLVGGQQQISGNFRAGSRRFPNGLALLRPPTGLGKINLRKADGGSAAGAQRYDQNQRPRVQWLTATLAPARRRATASGSKEIRGTKGRRPCSLTRKKK